MKDDLIVELLVYAVTGLGAIITWLVYNTFEMNKKIALNSQSDEEMKKHVDLLGTKIDKLIDSFNALKGDLLKGQVIDK